MDGTTQSVITGADKEKVKCFGFVFSQSPLHDAQLFISFCIIFLSGAMTIGVFLKEFAELHEQNLPFSVSRID